MYCVKHKLNGMIDVVHPTCKNEWCYIIANIKYNGYCAYCFTNMFPDKHVSRNYKTKEHTIIKFIKSKFNNYIWIFDKHIENGCSRRRPDILCDLGYQVLIIEVDEKQHTDYDWDFHLTSMRLMKYTPCG